MLKRFAAAAATAVLATGVLAAGTGGTARAATPSCGIYCIDGYSPSFTDGLTRDPSFVLDVYKQRQQIGQPVILFRSSNSDPAEDFTVSEQGTVNDFLLAGLVSPAVALHYGCVITATQTCRQPDGQIYPDDEAYEFEYAPFGAESGLCIGTGSAAADGVKVALEPCGDSAKTVWILDSLDSNIRDGEADLINGSDTNFSHPQVLTYPSASFPTDTPRPQFFTSELTGEAAGTGPEDSQLFSAVFGPLG